MTYTKKSPTVSDFVGKEPGVQELAQKTPEPVSSVASEPTQQVKPV